VAVIWDPVPISLILSARPTPLPVRGTTVLVAALDPALSLASGDASALWDSTPHQITATCTAEQLNGALTFCQGTWTEARSGPPTFQAVVGSLGAVPNSPDALLTSNPVQVEWAVRVDLSMQPTAAVGSASQATITRTRRRGGR
jgi:hypothetical protein